MENLAPLRSLAKVLICLLTRKMSHNTVKNKPKGPQEWNGHSLEGQKAGYHAAAVGPWTNRVVLGKWRSTQMFWCLLPLPPCLSSTLQLVLLSWCPFCFPCFLPIFFLFKSHAPSRTLPNMFFSRIFSLTYTKLMLFSANFSNILFSY